VTELLSEEDTDSAALNRVTQNLPWLAATSCAVASTFRTVRGLGEAIFAFRVARVRASITAGTPDTDYLVRISLTARILGTGGAFLPLRPADQTVHTDADGNGVSTWLDIDEATGLEIRAESCQVLPAP
jgi:hypothetical protein